MPASAQSATRWLADAVRSGPAAAAHTPSPVPLSAPDSSPAPPDAVLSDPAALGASAADPHARFPAGFAQLVVRRAYDEGRQELFGVAGDGGEIELPYTVTPTQVRPTDIGLANVRGDGEYPSEIFLAIYRWSRNQRRLVAWINDLRARYRDDLQFVIWDDTDYDIPWELLWLDEDRGRGLAAGCLGALVDVARWTTIRELSGSLLAQPSECSGGVIGYFDDTMWVDTLAFGPFIYRPHRQMGGFLEELEQTGFRAGLVYMGCHGQYGSSVYRLKLDKVTWGELDVCDMAALQGWRALVCLNACHSGRLVSNTGGGEDALRGFAELFLRKGAQGCIASAGKVGDDEAHLLITRLVQTVATASRHSVAAALRAFRAQAIAELPATLPKVPRTTNDDGSVNKEGQKQVLRFLYSFMFLYYGHPQTTLKLSLQAADDMP